MSSVYPFYRFVYLRQGKAAIIMVIGDLMLEKSEGSEILSRKQIKTIEKLYYEKFFRKGEKLAERWNWDFYCYSEKSCDFNRYRYDVLLIFFIGHGEYRGSSFLVIRENNKIPVKDIPGKIECNNLTVVVDSCYSVNWVDDFRHEHLNGLYTSDLENKTSGYRLRYKILPDNEIVVSTISSYGYFFLTSLYMSWINYTEANETSIDLIYRCNLPGSNFSNSFLYSS